MKRLPLHGLDPSGANDGDVPVYDAASDRFLPGPGGAGPGGGSPSAKTAAIKYSGTIAVGVGATRLYNDTAAAWTITGVRATVETTPDPGGSVTVDVNVDGTTIFTTQSNRPQVTAGNLTSGQVTTMEVTSVPAGSYLTVDVDATTAPAANLTVQIGLT